MLKADYIYKNLSQVLIGMFAIIIGLLCLYCHAKLILSPLQQEYREGAEILLTQQLLLGENLYDINQLPEFMSAYGPLYHLASYFPSKIFGSTLLVHRSVSGFFLIACCIIIYSWSYFKNQSRPLAASCAILLYATLLYFVTPISRPDTFGSFLYLSVLFIPYIRNFSTPSLAIAILISSLILITKIYFLVAPMILGLYLFFFVSRRKSIVYGVCLITALVATGFFATHLWDSFLNQTFASMSKEVRLSNRHLLLQINEFFQAYKPLILLPFIYYLIKITHQKNRLIASWLNRLPMASIVQRVLNKTLPKIEKSNYEVFCLACSTVITCSFFGRNEGAWMSYFYQLIAPFLILASTSFCANLFSLNISGCITLITASLFLSKHVQPLKPINPSSGWETINGYMKHSNEIYNSPALTTMMMSNNLHVYDSGFTVGSWTAIFKNPPLSNLFSNYNSKIILRNVAFEDSVREKIANHSFDYLMLDQNSFRIFSRDYLLQNDYYVADKQRISMPYSGQDWDIEIWRHEKQRGGVRP